jgi:hypothetical protein
MEKIHRSTDVLFDDVYCFQRQVLKKHDILRYFNAVLQCQRKSLKRGLSWPTLSEKGGGAGVKPNIQANISQGGGSL